MDNIDELKRLLLEGSFTSDPVKLIRIAGKVVDMGSAIINEIETLRAQLSQATAKTRALETEIHLLRVELDRATAGL